MDATTRFNSSNWSRIHLEKLSNCSLKVHYGGGKRYWWNFQYRNLGGFPSNDARTSNAMAKWMVPLDSAREIGPESTLKDFLIVDYSGCTERRKPGILMIGQWATAEASVCTGYLDSEFIS